MEACGCDQLLLPCRRVESQHTTKTREDAAPTGGQICIARIGPPNVSAQRAAQASWIVLVGELVQIRARRRSTASDRLRARRCKRFAIFLSAHHRCGQPLAQVRITARLPVQFAPEALHVLPQLAHHEIAAVASEVGLVWCVLGPPQQSPWVTLWGK